MMSSLLPTCNAPIRRLPMSPCFWGASAHFVITQPSHEEGNSTLAHSAGVAW